MVGWTRFFVMLCMVLGFLQGPALAQQSSAPRIAVLELNGQLSRGQLRVLSDKVRAGVLGGLQGKDYVVMTRESMAVLLKDMGIDCEEVQGECEVETGRNIGAAYVVSGSVEDVGGGLMLVSLKVHDTKSGALKSTGDVRGTEVIQLIDKLPGTVAQLIAQAFGEQTRGGMAPMQAPVNPGGPAQARFQGSFTPSGGLGVQAKLREQTCVKQSAEKGARQRASRLDQAVAKAKSQAAQAWQGRVREVQMCLRLKREERNGCISSVNQWLSGARSMNVKLPAGVETVQTDCGARQPAYPADSRTVVADDVSTAEKLLKRLMTYSPGHEGGTNSVGMSFIRVPTGNFQMGSTSQERYRDSDESLHRVTISRAFLIASTEVTQGQWATVMGRDPSKAQYRTANLRGSSYPVQQITWIEAVKFANALSRREGLQPAYTGSGSSVRWNQSANGYRLLTEAEWEYAARAGEHRLYAGAEQSGNLCGVANVADRSGSQVMKVSGVRCDDGFSATAPVGSFAPNAWNIYDMTGNVAEWCWDWYGTYSRYGSDPSGPSSGTYRTYRGGSWANTSRASRIAYRNRNKVDTRFDGLGFRMARNSN